MKKMFFLMFSIALILSSCQKESILEKEYLNEGKRDNTYYQNVKSAGVEAGLRFKHDGCNSPFGVCFTKPISNPRPEPPKPLWKPIEVEEGWGSAYLSIENEQMKIVPLRIAHNFEGKVIISEDIIVDKTIAIDLGYSRIIILKGEYLIDFNIENEYGKFYVDVKLAK